jgi:tetratricopeptide (TPR) repeat protein
MLETVREYAAEKLRASGEEPDLWQRHFAWCVGMADRAESGIRTMASSVDTRWLARLDADYDNVRAALHWSSERGDDPEATLRLCASLGEYWFLCGNLAEGLGWLEAAFDAAPDGPVDLRAMARYWTGMILYLQGKPPAAAAALEAALAAFRAAGLWNETVQSLLSLGMVWERLGEFDRAERLIEEALPIARDCPDPELVAGVNCDLGCLALLRGDYDRAERLLMEALSLIAMHVGDAERCVALTEESLALAPDHPHLVFYCYRVLGCAANLTGEPARARAMFAKALATAHARSDMAHVADVLEGLAGTAVLEGDAELALRLAGAASGVRNAASSILAPSDRAVLDRALEPARRALGEDRAERAFAAGSAMTIDEAVALALATPSS